VIRQEAIEVADIVEDLLAFTRLDTDAQAVAIEPFDVAEIAGGVVDRSGLDVAVSGSATASGDPGRVRQVVRNLLSNAARYGGPTVSMSMGVEDGLAVLEVVDDGAGVPAAHAERIFEPYERADRDHTEIGVGLGMYIPRSLARLMGDERAAQRTDRLPPQSSRPAPSVPATGRSERSTSDTPARTMTPPIHARASGRSPSHAQAMSPASGGITYRADETTEAGASARARPHAMKPIADGTTPR
jgi:hypothetical protein